MYFLLFPFGDRMAFSRNRRIMWKRDFFSYFLCSFDLLVWNIFAYWIDIMLIKYLFPMILILINLMPIRWIVEIHLIQIECCELLILCASKNILRLFSVIVIFGFLFFQTSVTTTSESECSTKAKETPGSVPVEEMTSKDYYFDSYGHFGIHEVGICFDLFLFQFCAAYARDHFQHVNRDLLLMY